MSLSYEEALAESVKYFDGDDLAAKVFVDKYALRDNDQNLLEATPNQMHERIARELYRVEKDKFKTPLSYEKIFSYLDRFGKIIPQGSPLYGIGNYYQLSTLSNCYVLDTPVDSYGGIHRTDEQLSQISKRRGGVGIDISALRPVGAMTHNAARTSTGIVPFMERFSNSIREVGQCVAKGERVLTRSGLKAIEKVKTSDEVWTRQGWVKVKSVFSNGRKKIVKTTSSFGYSVRTSEDHVFVSVDEDCKKFEKPIKDFKVGEDICLIPGAKTEKSYVKLNAIQYVTKRKNWQKRLKHFNLPEFLGEKLAYVLGYSYGDGHVVRDKFNDPYMLSLACCHDYPEIEERLRISINDVFGYESKSTPGDGAVNALDVCSKVILNFLKINEILKEKSGCIVFPSAVLKSPPSVQMAFISGYFDADGDYTKKVCYRFCSTCKKFLEQCQIVLMANGIVSKIHYEPMEKENWHDKYRLVIVGAASQHLFAQKATAEKIKLVSEGRIAKRDAILTPFISKELGVTRSKRQDYIPGGKQFVSYHAFTKLAEDGDDVGYPLIKDTVESIYLDGEEETYDLELEKEHLYWCEGFYVHNSGRRGAGMITISVHHPQVVDFFKCKRDLTKVTGANISVRLTDEFLTAVENGDDYEQRWPVEGKPVVSKMVPAREVWREIIENAHAMAEPGLLFWDTIIRESPADCYAKFGFRTESTNPCSELPLSPLDSCRLFLINLYSYVKNPFTENAFFDFAEFYQDSQILQRLMDDVIDLEIECIDRIIKKVESDPEPKDVKAVEMNMWQKVRKACVDGRRTGSGITALGDTMAALGIRYGSHESIYFTEKVYKKLKLGCYRSSVDMAKELGPFPVWDSDLEQNHPFLLRICAEDADLYSDMKKYGRRNIALLTTAPAGSVSILTQTTSGIEPLFMPSYVRRKKITHSETNAKVDFVDQSGDAWQEFTVYHPKIKEWMRITGCTDLSKSPWHGCCAEDLDWVRRVELQSAAHKHVDHSISSTINLPEDVSVEMVAKIYETAWKSGCKGITVYRKNCRTGVLVEKKRSNRIQKTTAPARPKTLDCDVHKIKIKDTYYFVLVGLLNNDPYEVFASKDLTESDCNKGKMTKLKRGSYTLALDSGETICSVNDCCTNGEEALTRMISTSLRHGSDIHFVVHQLEKVRGDMNSFAKAISRVLKKYIVDGATVYGENCQSCNGNLVRQDGCVKCMSCGWSKC